MDNFFGIENGGVLCPECVAPAPAASTLREAPASYPQNAPLVQPISLNALKILRFLQRGAHPTDTRLNIRQETHKEIEQIMQRYITHLLERKLKSVEFLKAL